MNKWKWLVRALLLLLLLSAFLVYKMLWAPDEAHSQEMALRHRVPVAGWRLYSHYCCTGQSCAKHHLEFRLVAGSNSEYVWSR